MWSEVSGRLERVFEFRSFSEAVSFFNEVCEIAEKLNHHPDISLFEYKKIRISTITHSEGRVGEKDYALLREVDKLFRGFEKG